MFVPDFLRQGMGGGSQGRHIHRVGWGKYMQAETRALLKSLGCELTYGLIEQTQQRLAAALSPPEEQPLVIRDLPYGPDARHRLDLFARAGLEGAPVLLFVHGGGYVMGDKCLGGLPFYDNVGTWAAARGWVGATMNYRLAPDNMWPSGAEDVGRAVACLRDQVAEHGGDPRRIFLMGQSAGATHIATYLSLTGVQPASGPGVAGAMLVSGTYDPALSSPNPYQLAYYGLEIERYGDFSTVPGLVKTTVPLCFAVSEYDAIDFRRQAALLIGAFGRARGDMPRFHWLPGHNHLSPVLAIGTAHDALGPLVSDFVRAVSPG